MMDLNLTKDEIEALKYYKGVNYEAINQLLVSNCETDIALLSDEVENKVVNIYYDKNTVICHLEVIKTLYELMIKEFYKNKRKEGWAFTRGTNIAEIERLKNELYIDKFLSTTKDTEKAKREFSSIWNRPAIINICGESNIPFIVVDEILGKQNENKEVIIAPFTRIKSINEVDEISIPDIAKSIRAYNVTLEKQELEELSEDEREGLYHFIIDNANSINRRLNDCIELEKENVVNYENIRKLEQLLSKYEYNAERKENEKDYSESEKNADLDDIARINKELNEIKSISSELFQIRKDNIDFITNWKKNIAVYMMAECREIELKYEALNEVMEEREELVKKQEVEEISENSNIENENAQNQDENIAQEEVANNELKIDVISDKEQKIEEYKKEIIKDFDEKEEKDFETIFSNTKEECKENIELCDKLLEDIKSLITKQQNHAKIAGNLSANYSALNNGFEMKKVADTLKGLVETIKLKVDSLVENENKALATESLKTISNVNLQISTLINYLNNAKIAAKNSKINRFDEMAIIEENELKRGIAERIREIRGEAELKKLKDDLEMIEEKGVLSRFFGIFTGKNKLDDFMIEQIEIRQKAIRRTLAKKMSLAHNYSIHELVAEIRMFVEENDDDELVAEDVSDLEALEDELKRNFIILESKVTDIIHQKEGKNLPVEEKKISKRDTIEIETYRFLNKYGYDLADKEDDKEPVYKDTVANEIARIVEYINSSNVLKL